MAPYRIPTDQVDLFRRSAHGVALFDQQNFAAPTCVSCHGSHSALPPAVTEEATVCGRCHQHEGRSFALGPHGPPSRAGRIEGCLACHGNHDTERVPTERIGATCKRCHADGTRGAVLGAEIQRIAATATDHLRSADSAIQRITRSGRSVGDSRFRYQTALTAYLQIAEAQHALDLERLEDLGLRVGSISRDLRAAALSAEERQWEHKLLLVPVWFIALSIFALAWLTLRRLEGRPGKS